MTMTRSYQLTLVLRASLVAGLFLGATIPLLPQAWAQGSSMDLSSFAAASEPPLFETPEAAADAFKSAAAAADSGAVAALLGLDPAKLAADEDAATTFATIRDGVAKQSVLGDLGEGRKSLQIGDKLWPLPFPLVKADDGKWAFDTVAGLEEIINRRVGENELQALATVRAYVDAQNDYASQDRDGDGVLEFAQRLISSEGATDGLYWPADLGKGESPAGPLIDEADLDRAKAGGYFGYRFRILSGQGDRIAGGAYDYVINGNMIAGFALLAWPAKYAETGVATFAVNQAGIIYEADLGPATESIVKYIERFNPDEGWAISKD
jgi:hypothetical protein